MILIHYNVQTFLEFRNPDGNAATSVVEKTVGMTVTERETDCQQLPIATGGNDLF